MPSGYGDGYCDVLNNVDSCEYDGGDCCLPNALCIYGIFVVDPNDSPLFDCTCYE